MIIWGETDGPLLRCGCFIKINNIVETQKPNKKRDSKIDETCRRDRVVVCGAIDCRAMIVSLTPTRLLRRRNRLSREIPSLQEYMGLLG